MGLEIVELGMMIEEEFGIHIEDADYERLKTVGDVERYVSWKLGRSRAGGWRQYDVSLVRGFCAIRREIVRQTGISRSDLRPSTRLMQHWGSMTTWRNTSQSLSAALEVPLPVWRVEGWMLGGGLAILVSPLVAAFLLAMNLDRLPLVIPAFVVTCTFAGAVLAARRARNQFRSADLAGVVRQSCYLMSQQDGESMPALGWPSQGHVMPRLQAMISENFSIPIAEIKPESRFIEDLAMG